MRKVTEFCTRTEKPVKILDARARTFVDIAKGNGYLNSYQVAIALAQGDTVHTSFKYYKRTVKC